MARTKTYYTLTKKSIEDIRHSKYLYMMFKSMRRIGRKMGSVLVRMDNDEPINIAINERNYIIFLSYTLGSLKGGKIGKYNKKLSSVDYINGEIYKQIKLVSDGDANDAYNDFVDLKNRKQKKEICDKVESRDYVNTRPDFVIHDNHIKQCEDSGQKLIVEAKTTNRLDEVDFCWDLLKLNVYINEFHFQNAIYMLVNTNIDQIEHLLDVYNEYIRYYAHDIKKLWFFVQKWNGKQLLPVEIFQLENIMSPNNGDAKVICETVNIE